MKTTKKGFDYWFWLIVPYWFGFWGLFFVLAIINAFNHFFIK